MSMTVVNAKIYVSRVLGGSASQEVLDMAGEAILRGYQDWEKKKYWRFLLKDTSATTSVSGCTATAAASTVEPPTTGDFNFVNVGQTVTLSGSTATLAAGTTVSSITRNSSGDITQITLSNAFGGSTDATTTCIFSADIPITAGSNEYSLPLDYNVAATAKFTVTNPHRTLIYRTQEYWDRTQPDETLEGLPSEFTTYNPISALTQNYGETRLKFDRVPDASDTMRLRYFRKFTTDGTYIDVPDNLLYQFLDYCRSILLSTKRAQDDPKGYRDEVLDALETVSQDDGDPVSENDIDECVKSQYEMWSLGEKLPWNNGDFDATR